MGHGSNKKVKVHGFGFISGQWEEVESRHPSLYTLYDVNWSNKKKCVWCKTWFENHDGAAILKITKKTLLTHNELIWQNIYESVDVIWLACLSQMERSAHVWRSDITVTMETSPSKPSPTFYCTVAPPRDLHQPVCVCVCVHVRWCVSACFCTCPFQCV